MIEVNAIIIIAHLSHEHNFLFFLLLQEPLIVLILMVVPTPGLLTLLLLILPNRELAIKPILPLRLPRRIIHLRPHHLVLLHLIQNIIDSMLIHQLLNHLLMLRHVPVHEIQALGQDLHLVDYLLELEWHDLGDYLWLGEKGTSCFLFFVWVGIG